MNLLTIGWVAIGGAIGSVSRFVLSTAILRLSGSLFPVGTFAVNGREPSNPVERFLTPAPPINFLVGAQYVF